MWREEDKLINGLYFKQTCIIAPEQYDVFLDGKYVAYVRCRWGKLSVNPVNIELNIPNIDNISDDDYEKIMEDNRQYEIGIDFNTQIYFKEWKEEPYKSDIPNEEFENITNAIYNYLKNKEEK